MVRSSRKPLRKRAKRSNGSKYTNTGPGGRKTPGGSRRGDTSLADLPASLRDYLSSSDQLFRAALQQQYPGLERSLPSARVRSAVVAWLAGDEAPRDEFAEVAANALDFIRTRARASEARIARRFVLHPHPLVRLRADEFLLTLYFPNRNPNAMLSILQSMLLDPADLVRAQAVRYAERIGIGPELRMLLQQWLDLARAQGFASTEGVELAERLVGGPAQP